MSGRAARLQRLVRAFDFAGAGKWLALAAMVGIVAGVGAMAFQAGLQSLQQLCVAGLAGLDLGHPGGERPLLELRAGSYLPWLVVLLPALGGLVSGVLVWRLAPEAEGHGTDAAIDAYHRRHGLIRGRVPLVKMVASVVTIGTGGSGGREGPIAQIGAGFGSYLATKLGLGLRERRWLLAAGMGAGIGAIFRAPLAGALFAGEILYSSHDVETEVLLPATVSSIVAYAVYASRFGWGHMFEGAGAYGFSSPLELGPYLVLAMVLAFVALVYVKVFYGTRAVFAKLPLPRPLRPMLGGGLTGLLALALLASLGTGSHVGDVLSSGYGIIQAVISSDGASVTMTVLLAVCFGKIVTTSLSIGSGGSGGVFGPSMVIGASVGAWVGKVFHALMPTVVVHPSAFAIVGMAGFFAAAANAPISTVIMVSELTGNYELLVPAMWVCSFAFLVGKRWSIYEKQVPSKLWSPAHSAELAGKVFAGASVADVFSRTRKLVRLPTGASLDEILDATQHTRQRIFPVTRDDGSLAGSFRIDDLTHAMHEPEPAQRAMSALALCGDNALTIGAGERVERAQQLLSRHHVDELLVVDDESRQRVLGIVTSADILLAYTRRLASMLRAEPASVTSATERGRPMQEQRPSPP